MTVKQKKRAENTIMRYSFHLNFCVDVWPENRTPSSQKCKFAAQKLNFYKFSVSSLCQI